MASLEALLVKAISKIFWKSEDRRLRTSGTTTEIQNAWKDSVIRRTAREGSAASSEVALTLNHDLSCGEQVRRNHERNKEWESTGSTIFNLRSMR